MAANAQPDLIPAYLLLRGGWRSGKSTVALYKAIELTLGYPGNVGLILRKSYPELKDTTIPFVVQQLCAPNGPCTMLKDPPTLEAPNGSKILFRSAVQDGKEDPAKFGSLELGWFWIEEASEVGHLTYSTLKGRLSMKGVPRIGILTTNPPDKRHWLFKEFETDARLGKWPSHASLKIDTRENAHNLASGYVEQLESQYGPSWVKRYLDGEWGVLATGDPVLPEYDEKLHVSAVPYMASPDRPLLRGWDAHPNGLYIGVVWAQLGPNRRLHHLRSELFERTGVKRAIEDVQAITRQYWPLMGCLDFGDPAMFIQSKIEMVSIADVMQRYKINLMAGASAFNTRREVMAEWLQRLSDKQPAYQINNAPETLMLRDGMAAGYCWPSLDEGYVIRKVPEKNEYSHVVEADMYLLTGLGDWMWAQQVPRKDAALRSRTGWMSA